MIIFSQARGKVARIPEGRTAVPFKITIEGATGKGDGTSFQKAIITQAAIEQHDNYQFLHTLWDTIYVYIFGTRIGDLTVSGMAFADTCWARGDGPREIMQFYKQNRIAVRGKPVTVVFGSWPFKAFLTGLNVQINDAERTLGQFTFRFSVFPER